MSSFPPAPADPSQPVATLPPRMPVADSWASGPANQGRGPRLHPRLPQSRRAVAIGVAVLVVVLAAGAYFFVGRGKAPATPEKTALALSFTNGQSSQYRFTMSVTGQATAKGIGSSINDQLTGMSTWH